MGTTAGKDGIVKVGANAVANVREWSVETTGDTAETTAMGDDWRTFVPTVKSWQGSLSAWWDETDSNGQGALTEGAQVTLNLYPEGDVSGDTYYTGDAIVTSVSRAADNEGIWEAQIGFQGTGALSEATVA